MKRMGLINVNVLIVAALLLCGAARAAVLLSDDFESDTVGTEPSNALWTGNNNAGTTTLNVEEDGTGALFGVAGNKYLALIDDTASSAMWIRSAETFSNTLLTLSFDYYQPTVSGQAGDISLGIGVSSTVATLAHDIEFSAGTIEGVVVTNGLDNVHYVDLVMNNTGAAVDYNGVSLDHNHIDIWVDGFRIVAGQIALATGRDIAVTGFKFSTINPYVESLYIDNLKLRDEAYVGPEDNGGDPDPVSSYNDWMAGYTNELSVAEQDRSADPDADGLENLMEYAVGGNPTTNDSAVVGPVLLVGDDVQYVYNRRTNYVDLGLSYYLELSTNLVTTALTNDASMYSVAVSAPQGGFEAVTNSIVTSNAAVLFRLTVEEQGQ